MIKGGRLGQIYLVKYTSRWRRNRSGIEYHPMAKWFLDKSKAGGGVGINWGIYDLSFIYGLFDDNLELEEAVAFGNREVDDVNHMPQLKGFLPKLASRSIGKAAFPAATRRGTITTLQRGWALIRG